MSASLDPWLAGVRGAVPTPLDRAILRTLAYAWLFRFPLTLAQLERRLMDVPAGGDELRARLRAAPLLSRVALTGGRLHPPGCEAWLAGQAERAARTRALLDRHGRALALLARCPYVRLVALSGACAHDNAGDDDVDVFLVVRRGRAWLVALALTVGAKLLGLRRTLCLNYIVDEHALALPEQDLFTAAEIVGLRPLAGGRAYRRFVHANPWLARHFPNFFAAAGEPAGLPEPAAPPGLEAVLDRTLAELGERLARRVLGWHLRRRLGDAPGVRLEPHRLKLHARDHRPRLMQRFAEALRELGETP